LEMAGLLGVIAVKQGRIADAAAHETRLQAMQEACRFGETSYWRAAIAAQRGEHARAVDLLRQSFAEGKRFTTNLHIASELEPLRGNAAFDALLRPR
ncbi:MAG: hypothetical protein ACSLFE_09910, partial [Gemmatimonadaceae bacterium]